MQNLKTTTITKTRLTDTETDWWFGLEKAGEVGKGGQKVQTSSDKVSKSSIAINPEGPPPSSWPPPSDPLLCSSGEFCTSAM